VLHNATAVPLALSSLTLAITPEALATGQLIMAAVTLLPFFIINGVSNDFYRPQSVIAMLCLGIFSFFLCIS
jgi:hypothetical protein